MPAAALEFATGKRHKVPEPKLEIREIAFKGNIPFKEWPGGAAIPDVVWKKTANPDKPVCYLKKSTNARISALIRYESVALAGKAKISIRAKSAAPALEWRKTDVELKEDQDVLVEDIPVVSGSLENKVAKLMLDLDWEVSYDKGSTWLPIHKTGPHAVFQIEANPLESPLFDKALEKACGYVNGRPDAVFRINRGIPGDFAYDPAVKAPSGNPLTYYSLPPSPRAGNGKPACLCMDNATLLRYLARSIGIPADLVFIWGGNAPANVVFYWYGMSPVAGAPGNCSFQVLVAAKDASPADPHFTYHAQTVAGGKTYDPSYGNVGMIALNETAPGCARQTGPVWPPAGHFVVSWRCGH